jgi:hypothetical protein
MYLASNLTGVGYLSTPLGEEFRLHLGGSMRKHLNLSTDGEAIYLYMDYWPALYGQFIADRRPSIEVRGHWKNPDLVMDDHGSIFRAFLPMVAFTAATIQTILTMAKLSPSRW